ncbi:type II secretion system protein GspD [Litorivivens sp.]|uniref:type II secretion system protein GspD n=1 Tax=Litorivivens sp. TaxID=2020868 RepID=UPI003562FF8C
MKRVQRLRTAVCHMIATLLLFSGLAFPVIAEERFSMSANDTPVRDVMAMLAQKGRVSILLEKDVKGDISFNLYDVTMDEAVGALAEMAGFAAEKRGRTYYIIDKKNVGVNATGGLTSLKAFPIRYAEPQALLDIAKNYISLYGKVTLAAQERVLVIEDKPDFLAKIHRILKAVDSPPRQILIEAKIFEITLNDGLAHGINWTKLFSVDPGEVKQFGVQGLAAPGAPGLFVNVVNDNIELLIDALQTDGRLRTISTPKLLALENKEASVVVGERIGYRVTTTINQVTTESIEFLESGVILRVTPSIDADNRVMLDIYPQISTGSINDGIPSKNTTEVATNLITNDKQTVFIGGLLKNTVSETASGVPFLKDIPLIGRLFASREKSGLRTETVVLITPYIVSPDGGYSGQYIQAVEREEKALEEHIGVGRFAEEAIEAERRREMVMPEPAQKNTAERPKMRGPRR